MVDGSQISGSVAVKSNAPRVSTTGTLTSANATMSLAVDGMSTISMQIGGTWAGTIALYGSMDGGATYPYLVGLKPVGGGGGPTVSSFTGNGGWDRSAAAYTHIQAQGTITSGSATVLLAAYNGVKFARVEAPATDPLPILGTVTANLGTLNGAALDASVQAVKTTLGSPFQAGGSIGNTAFGISGTLPAFAATPTFNIGTAPTLTVQGTLSSFGYASASSTAPTYTAGNQPLSQTLAGQLRTLATTDQTTHGTTDKVAADLYVGGALATNANPAPTALATGATMTTSQPSVTTTAATLTFAGSVRRSIYNPAGSANSIFIGGASVTTATGWEVPPGAVEDVSRFTGSVYAVATAATTIRLISY